MIAATSKQWVHKMKYSTLPITLSMAMFSIPALAQSNVDIYGHIKMGAEYGKQFGSVPGTQELTATTRVQDWTSRIGFKGKENLGDGLAAIWQVETKIDMDTGGGRWGTRDTFLGMESAQWGRLKMGRNSNYINGEQFPVMEFWEVSQGVNNLHYLNRTGIRINNSLRYESPEISGLSGALLYGTNEGSDELNNVHRYDKTFNLGFTYKAGPFTSQYSFQRYTGVVQNGDDDIQRLHLSFDDGRYNLGFAWQKTSGYNLAFQTYNPAAFGSEKLGELFGDNNGVLVSQKGKLKSEEFALTGHVRLGAWTPRLTLATGRDLKLEGDTLDGTGYRQAIVGANYDFSKRTKAILNAGIVRWDSKINGMDDTEYTVALGLSHAF